MIQLRRILLPLFFLIMLSSCDDRLLRKTVSVENLTGELSYNPTTPSLSGKLNYKIRNKQNDSLSEIYLFCHPSVQIEFLSYNHQAFRFEQWIGFGYGLYRIKIPELRPNETANIEVKFIIKGPITENRYSLTKTSLFFDAKKVWLPLPFAEVPNFPYELKIKTPSTYYPILGSKLIDIQSNHSELLTTWQSETDNPLVSGNLMIIRSQQFKSQNIYLYTTNMVNVPIILSNTEKVINLFTNKIKILPFSQFHIVDYISPYKDMETFINGEFLGNMINLSPKLLDDPSLIPLDASLTDSCPLLMNNNYLNIIEALAHEMSHSYFGGVIQFDEDQSLDGEVITEFLALNVVRKLYPKHFDAFMTRNRFILLNLFLDKETENVFWNYLYGINLLNAAFSDNQDGIFDLVQALVEKYRYTQMNMEDIQTTIEDLNREIEIKNKLTLASNASLSNETTLQSDLIPLYHPEYLNLYKQKKFFNTRIFLSNSLISNKETVTTQNLLVVQNQFPISIEGSLQLLYQDKSFTNFDISVKPNSSLTLLLSNQSLLKASFLPPSLCIEYQQNDNTIPVSPLIVNTEASLSNFYTLQSNNLLLTNLKPASTTTWLSANKDRQLSLQKTGQSIQIKIDQTFFESSNNTFYATGYKWSLSRPLSYALFQLQLNNNNNKQSNSQTLVSVFDPSF